jgi:hypothetical protein
LNEIMLLKDEEISVLCKIVQWPGSTDNDESHTVSHKAEKNLKLCAHLIKHWTKCISWPCKNEQCHYFAQCSSHDSNLWLQGDEREHQISFQVGCLRLSEVTKTIWQLSSLYEWRAQPPSCICDAWIGWTDAGRQRPTNKLCNCKRGDNSTPK